MTKYNPIGHHFGMRVNKKSVSHFVLAVLEKSVDVGVRFDDFCTNTHLYAYYGWRELPKSNLSKALSRLKGNGVIEEVNVDGNLIFKLTDEGRMLVPDDKKWDGQWRIVMFDIPEGKRLVRSLFRRNLKKWGFKQLQKSVWVTKRNCYERLSSYIVELGIEPWVIVFETSRIGPT